MPSARKPNPKSQLEIQNSQIEPYVFPETGESYGNPNIPSQFNQFTDKDQSGIDFNRSEQMSFKNDTTKPFTVGLQDIDESIMYYFQNVIRPTEIQNGNRLAVPVIYGSPEKWKSVQKDGYYRDEKGKIMAPLIMFKRESLDKNRSIANKLDANNPNNYQVFTKSYDSRNAYSNFNILNNRKPERQFYNIVVPDYITLTYNFAIFTYYIEQLNKIVEAIEYASDAYWGNPQRFQFKAMIDSFTFQTELVTDNERTVKSTFTLKINGYIIPNTIQKDTTALNKSSNKTQINISEEAITNIFP